MSFHRILEIQLTCKFIILNHEQIKILNSSLFFAILSLKKNIHKKIQATHSFSIYFFFFYIHTTNYKNSKLNKNYINQFKIYKIALKPQEWQGRLSRTTGTVAGRCSTWHHHWRHMSSLVVADKGSKTVGLGASSSSILVYAVSEGHHHLQQGVKRTNNN